MVKLTKATRLKLAIGLATVFMVIETVGGFLSNSLAILSDAAHLLSDIAGFVIALIALVTSIQPGTVEYTYGLARAEIFGAILSIISLWVITVWLVFEAFGRAWNWFEGRPKPIDGKLMFFIAVFGILVNVVLMVVFHDEHGGLMDQHCHDHGHDHAEYELVPTESPLAYQGSAAVTSHDHDHDHISHRDIESGHHDHDHDHGHEHEHDHQHSGSSCCGGQDKEPSPRDHDHNDHDHDHSHKDDSCNHHCTKDARSSEATGLISSKQIQKSYGDSSSGHDHDHQHSACGNSLKSMSTHDHSHSHDHHSPHGPHTRDANIEAAYLHVITDLIQSVGVAIAGLAVWLRPDWVIVDPICTFLFSLMVLYSTIPLMRKMLVVLLEGKPESIDWKSLEQRLFELPDVVDVHDLHVWNLSSSVTAMTIHIKSRRPQTTLEQAHAICRELHITHATIQVQDANGRDISCPSHGCRGGTAGHLCVIPSNVGF